MPVRVEITVRFGGTRRARSRHVEPQSTHRQPPRRLTIDPDYTTRGGYDPAFLGTSLPLPESASAIAAALSPELQYHHFSVRDAPSHAGWRMFTAVNIDGGADRYAPAARRDRWIRDPRIAADEQTDEAVYATTRSIADISSGGSIPAWGPAAKAANDDTFHFTNCTPQHHDFNAGQHALARARGLRAA